MANKFAVAAGNFNATSTWSDTPAGSPGASVPVAGDNAYANGRAVTITANATCTKISTEAENGATAGGSFALNAGVTLTANVAPGTTTCLTASYASPGVSTVSGNITGSATASQYGAQITGTGTLNILGSITGGSNTASYGLYVNGTNCTVSQNSGNVTGGSGATGYGIYVAASSTVTVVGSVTAGTGAAIVTTPTITITVNLTITGSVSAGSGSSGIIANHTLGYTNISGNIYGGSSAACYGLSALGAAPISITGNVYGGSSGTGYGINASQPSGTNTVVGNVYGSDSLSGGWGIVLGGTLSYAVWNITGSAICGKQGGGIAINTTGGSPVVRATRAVGNGYGAGSTSTLISVYGITNPTNQNASVYVEELQYGALGNIPVYGPVILTDLSSNKVLMYRATASQKTLVDPVGLAGAVPAATDVRYGTVYNNGSTTGTCYVPPAASVGVGVPVDNTTGTAALTPANIWAALTSTLTTSGSIGERLANASTVTSTGQQLSNALSA